MKAHSFLERKRIVQEVIDELSEDDIQEMLANALFLVDDETFHALTNRKLSEASMWESVKESLI